jgi:type III secretion protein Q
VVPGLPPAVLDLSEGRVAASTGFTAKETEVADPTPKPPAGGAPPDPPLSLPADLELPLSLEIGRITMTLREIERLAPGTILEAGSDPMRPVTVTCHGRSLARGLLVDLGDGRLGVQLTEGAATGGLRAPVDD